MDEVLQLLNTRGEMSSGDVASELGISRQAAHRHLSRLAASGAIQKVGAGRTTRYRAAAAFRKTFSSPSTLDESRVWDQLRREVAALGALEGEALSTFGYVFTELFNNVIDHSEASAAEVVVSSEGPSLEITIEDNGIGVFRKLQRQLHLESELAALQEVTKGKVTTDPARHTGEGLFFSSKAADRFALESGRIAYLVDNLMGDYAVRDLDEEVVGTRVTFAARPSQPRNLEDIFHEYTVDYEFKKTRTVVKLFAIGVHFISRSEAKRLSRGLEHFDEVVVDFAGVSTVGQGFADELFRVWAKAHPQIRLVPVSMSPGVEMMVRRASGTG